MSSESERELDFIDLAELNEGLKDETITLFLPSHYDRSLLPVKAENFRSWWQQDRLAKDHARFCLPLAMASSIGYYILSPATFTVEWSGSDDDLATIEIIDACSHAKISNMNICGSFNVQAVFVPRTKRAGDFLYLKGVANQFRLPYTMTEAVVETWWTPANFGLIYMLNQPGKFTINKGEPIAQMFVVNKVQAEYSLEVLEGDPPGRGEWIENVQRRHLIRRDYEYLRGAWHDGRQVKEHVSCWRGNRPMEVEKSAQDAQDVVSTRIQSLSLAAFRAFKKGEQTAAQKALDAVLPLLEAENSSAISRSAKIRALSFAELLLNNGMTSQAGAVLSALETITDGDDVPLLAKLKLLWATLKQGQGDVAGAEQVLLNCLKLLEKSPEAQWRGQSLVGLCCDDLARLCIEAGRGEEAEKRLVGAACAHEHAGKRIDAVESRTKLVQLLLVAGKYPLAQQTLQEIVESRKQIFGDSHPQVGFALMDLAFSQWRSGLPQPAQDNYQKALEIFEQRLGPHSQEACQALQNLAFYCRDNGKLIESAQHFQNLAKRQEVLDGSLSTAVIRTTINLAFVFRDAGKKEEAADCFLRAVNDAKLLASSEETNDLLAEGLRSLAFLRSDAGQLEEAIKLFAEAFQVRPFRSASDLPSIKHDFETFSALCRDAGRPDLIPPSVESEKI